MKLVDEKGKLFGIINIIDLSVLLIIVLLAGFAGYKVVGRKLNIASSPTKDVIVTVRSQLATESVSKSIHPGDSIVGGTTFVDGKIESVTVTQADYTTTTDDGRVLVGKHPTRYDLLVTFKVRVNTGSAVLKIGTDELHAGTSFLLKTKTVQLNSYVESIEIK